MPKKGDPDDRILEEVVRNGTNHWRRQGTEVRSIAPSKLLGDKGHGEMRVSGIVVHRSSAGDVFVIHF